MPVDRASDPSLDPQLEIILAPLRQKRQRAKRIFILGSLPFIALGFVLGMMIYPYWGEAAFVTAILVMAGGAHFAHQPLAGIDKRIRELIEPAVLAPYQMRPAGYSDPRKLVAPFAALGMVPVGIDALSAHRYEQPESGLWVEEIRVYGIGHDINRDNRRRLLFFWPIVAAAD